MRKVSECRNPGDAPRMEDFQIVPENNYGVSHAFNETVRGKEARKSLIATPCADCQEVFYMLRID